MADYYPLIARAVAGLKTNAGEARRSLYERARTALITQLRGIDPPLSESDITRERLALEEAIRKVESEVARRVNLQPPRTEPISRPRATSPRAPAESEASPPRGADATARPPATRPPERDTRSDTPPRARPSLSQPDDATTRPIRPPSPSRPAPPSPPPPRNAGMAAPNRRPPPEMPSLSAQSMRGFRDVVAEADDLGRAAAQASRAARKTYAEVPSPSAEFDRLEPDLENRGVAVPDEVPYSYDESREEAEKYARAHQRRVKPEAEVPPKSPGTTLALVRVALAMSAVAAVVLLAFFLWRPIENYVKSFGNRTTPEAAQNGAPANQPKITDRVGYPSSSQQVAAVAQRVVLYDEDPAEPQGKQYVGTAVWRTESVPSTGSQPPEIVARADIDVPDRKMKVTLSFRRSIEANSPVSHTIELAFVLPQDSTNGGVANVPGILMKSAEQTRGTPLAGQSVKVTDGFFLVGLVATDADKQRNIQLLKERPWFDVPLVYANQRRAILAIEKGSPGERAFADAFSVWKQ
jgi:hypothetical protein